MIATTEARQTLIARLDDAIRNGHEVHLTIDGEDVTDVLLAEAFIEKNPKGE